MPKPRDHVQSVARVFSVLGAFGPGRNQQSLAAVAREAGLDRAVARRYLLTLESLGYIARTGDHFTLTPRVLTLARTYLNSTRLEAVAEESLRRLREITGESCAVTVLSHGNACFVVVNNAEEGLSIRLTVGNELPAYCTAMGRVLLSGWEDREVEALLNRGPLQKQTPRTLTDPAEVAARIQEVRRRGWDIADEEMEIGVRSVAVPLRNPSDQLVAALSITTPVARRSMADLRGPLRLAAERTAGEIGGLL